MVVDTVREEQAIRQMTERLVENFGGTYSPEYIEEVVGAARRRFAGHPVRTFIPILVERYVRRQLAAAGEVADASSGPDTARTRRARHKAESGDRRLPAAVRETWSANKRFAPAAVAAVVAALVVVTVVTVALAVRQPNSAPQAAGPGVSSLALVRGVVGSEKMSFFQDPKVAEVLARNGVKVEVDAAGSREIATSVDLGKYEFAFPSSEQAAERIQRQRNVNAKYIPFSSPMAIATFKPIADLLAKSGVVHQGPVPTFDMAPYLRMVGNNTRWDQLGDNTAYSVRKNVLISTTDPRSSNSAAMYLAIAGYVANNNTIVQGTSAEQDVIPTVSRLFVGQGYTQNSSEGPFDAYLAAGMGPTPLVWIYESQFVDATVRGQVKPDMTLLYPSPTILSRHTLVPLGEEGDRIGRLLSTDPDLQRLAAEHGFRTGDATQFAKVTTEHNIPVASDLIDVITTPTFDTLERLLDGVGKSYN
ncbi:three-helix bundle dimerization domain-containing protein [Nocardia sp. NPDC051321]|uniref:three-helix bundle dimerization domain-containing protein n=1 Tax=Nocardia sp. NPDC051321 TaxID=3364323 RepID=UPI003789DBFE